MDHQTKALLAKGMLHTSGLVTAHNDAHHAFTTITAFPPSVSLSISDQMAHHLVADDPDHAIAYIAKHIGHQVQKTVEEQILKAWKMSAKDAMDKVMDAKMTFLQNTPWMPFDKKDDAIWKLPHVEQHLQTIPVNHPWNDPEVDVLQNIKDVMAKFELKPSQENLFAKIWADQIKGQFSVDPSVLGEWCDSPEPPTPRFPDVANRSGWTAPLHDAIPGFARMKQRCPVTDCESAYHQDDRALLQNTIIHLNDKHKWTREAIADWLETLDHDLTFKIPEEVK